MSKVKQFTLLLVAVVVVVTASIFFQSWWNNRPGPDPATVEVTAELGGVSVAATPYSLCEPGVPCKENTVTELSGSGDLHLVLPKDIYDHDWALLKVYDDPAKNTQDYFAPNEKKDITFPTADGDAKLVVVEVSSAMVGRDANGEETPMTVTWSFHVRD